MKFQILSVALEVALPNECADLRKRTAALSILECNARCGKRRVRRKQRLDVIKVQIRRSGAAPRLVAEAARLQAGIAADRY